MKKYNSVFKEEFNPKKLDSLDAYIVSFLSKCILVAMKQNNIPAVPIKYSGTSGYVLFVKNATTRSDLGLEFAIGWGLNKNSIWLSINSSYVMWDSAKTDEIEILNGKATVEYVANWISKNIAS